MSIRTGLRLLTAATLVATFGAGCAKAPFASMPAVVSEDGFDALSSPVNAEATAVARNWAKDAFQAGVMINRSPKGVQDTATYVFASKKNKTRMLIVIAANGTLQAQELAVNEQTAKGLAAAMPLTKQLGAPLNSKKLFKQAEAAGLENAEDVVVMTVKGEGGSAMPVAIVTDKSGQNYITLNALNGQALSAPAKLGARKVQVHILVIGGVVLAVAVGAAVWWAVKKWREKGSNNHPTPQPSSSAVPTPVPTATPLPTPVPTSKPSTKVYEILEGPFGAQFDRLDASKDGKLTFDEYLAPAKDDATKRVKTSEYKEFIDTAHRGAVSRVEFLQGKERSIGSLAQMSFSMLDSDQNSGLDRAESGSVVNAEAFRSADTNGDGKLSLAEYLVPFAKNEATFAQYY
jgi:hypothetical protein